MPSEPVIHGPAKGQSARCAPILRALPQWFGVEEATQHYIEQVDALPTLVATVDGRTVGFLSLKQHSDDAAEIYVMGILPSHHRRGIGRALLAAAEAHLRAHRVRFLQVKTLSSAHPDEHYAKTRAFYRALGFSILEEFPDLWDPANPALQLIKYLG